MRFFSYEKMNELWQDLPRIETPSAPDQSWATPSQVTTDPATGMAGCESTPQ